MMNKIIIKLEGLNCANCANKIEARVGKLDYVSNYSLNFLNQQITIIYENKTGDDVLKDVTKIVHSLEDGVDVYEDGKKVEKERKVNQKFIRLIIGFILIPIIYFTDFKYQIVLETATFLIFGYDVILKAVKNILNGNFFDENFLMSFATVSAFAIGEVSEAIGVMLFFQVGEYFQDLAVDNSKRSIKSLMDLNITSANLIKDDKVIVVDPSDLQLGDIIEVKVGEKVPVDGIVIDGNTQIDTSSLTGESVPRVVNQDDKILSGVINLTNVINVRVEKIYADSTISKILELVNESSEKKAKTEQFITKFSKVYTPIVILLAALLTIIPTILDPSSFGMWFERSLIFLVISCPCALVVSIPLTFFSGIGHSSRKGILVKGGNYLQALSECNNIVFDKTGTLTKGTFKVTNFTTTINESEFINYLYSVEKKSNHPIAKSIISYFETEDLKFDLKATDYKIEEVAGMGVVATQDNQVILVGSYKLLEKYQVNFEKISSNGSIVYIALNNEYIGNIVVADTIKDKAVETIAKLKARGIKTTMLTGDNSVEAKYISEFLGVDNVHYELLPNEKVEVLSDNYLKETNVTAFVGDGINDAPALKRSDIGIAMGALGSDAAVEASDIVIMNDDISSVNTAIDIAKKTVSIAKQNIVMSLGFKSIILLLGAMGLASMWLAIFADVGVALLAILNASRNK